MSILIKISKNDETLGEIEEHLRDTSSMSALLDSLRAAKMSSNNYITNLVESDKKLAEQPDAEHTESATKDEGKIEEVTYQLDN